MASRVDTSELGAELERVNVAAGKASLDLAAQICQELTLTPSDFARRWDRFVSEADTDAAIDGASLDRFKRIVQMEFAAARKKRITAVTPRGGSAMAAASPVAGTGGRFSRTTAGAMDSVASGTKRPFAAPYGSPSQQQQQQQQQQREEVGKHQPLQPRQLPMTTPVKAMRGSLAAGSPGIFSPNTLASPLPAAPEQYASRTNSGAVEVSFNVSAVSDAAVTSSGRQRRRCDIGVPADVPRTQFMYTPLDTVADVLDERIEILAEAIVAEHGLPAPSPLHVPSIEPAVFVGRVCCESEGRLNPTALMLEGSRALSMGVRRRLCVDDVEGGFALFPGQIIAVRGTSDGRRISATEVFHGAKARVPRTAGTTLRDNSFGSANMDGRPLTMMCAQGPYTFGDDLDYRPLRDLVAAAKASCPDVLVLMGPFVDEGNSLIAAGKPAGATHQDLFDEIVRLLHRELSALPIHVLVVPSTSDVHADFVFPQPSMRLPADVPCGGPSSAPDAPERWTLRSLPNPATFAVNEVIVALTPGNVLFKLGADEVSRKGPEVLPDRIGRLAAHLVQQRSVFPLFPVPVGSQLNIEELHRASLDVTPDIIVSPSQFRYSVKDVDGTVVINPGSLTKGNASAGTYARVAIAPYGSKDLSATEELAHDVNRRARVDVVRV